jgi:hypothetical protein
VAKATEEKDFFIRRLKAAANIAMILAHCSIKI